MRSRATAAVGPACPGAPSDEPVHAVVRRWYAEAARDLPWRRPGVEPWSVLVSEVMLQQTQVDRVLPAYEAWVARWPRPADLAAAPAGEAVRQWGRLGYPRRALRLHAAATAIVERHGGAVPGDLDELLALPGVGAYTARAVASFAFRQRHAVLDTNVRRVLARVVGGDAGCRPALTADEQVRAERLLPADPDEAATYAVAVMELGALVCTARNPRCSACPLADRCRWRLAGAPIGGEAERRRTQRYEGTDRQVRGRLLALLRDAHRPLPPAELEPACDDREQRARALAGLVADGLAVATSAGYQLPD